jgi:hypothetical protein
MSRMRGLATMTTSQVVWLDSFSFHDPAKVAGALDGVRRFQDAGNIRLYVTY